MKFRCDIGDLKGALVSGTKMLLNPSNLNKSKDDPMVLLDVSEGRLSVLFPGNVSMKVGWIECVSDSEFKVRIDPKMFLDFVNGKDGEVTFTFDPESNRLVMKACRGRMSCVYMRPPEYVSVPVLPSNVFMSAQSSYFVSVLKRAVNFASKDPYRPNLMCVVIKIENGIVEVASTDMFRCFRHRKAATGATEGFLQISPVASCLLMDFLDGKESRVDFYTDEKYSYIVFDDVIIYDLKYDSKFPNYNKLFDRFESNAGAMVNKQMFLASASITKNLDRLEYLRMELKNPVTLSASRLEKGIVTEEEVPATSSYGEASFYVFARDMYDSARAILGTDLKIEYSPLTHTYKMYNPSFPLDEVLNSEVVNHN